MTHHEVCSQLTVSGSYEAISLVPCDSQAVISGAQLWGSVMQGQQHSTWAECTVQPPGYWLAGPVVAVIKFLPEEMAYKII